jgi:hypothetical protein
MQAEHLEHELAVAKEPTDVAAWVSFVRAVQANPAAAAAAGVAGANQVNVLLERAVAANPYSYKLWALYLAERRAQLYATDAAGERVLRVAPDHAAVSAVVALHQRALEQLPFPRLFLELGALLLSLGRFTAAVANYTVALWRLPLSQHRRIW